jgi:hypothetical protein
LNDARAGRAHEKRRCGHALLVHVGLFGGSYVGEVEATLARFGCQHRCTTTRAASESAAFVALAERMAALRRQC